MRKNQRQKWETFDTNAEAKKRKSQIEFEQQNGTFIVPTARTVKDLLEEYTEVYGVSTWSMSTYSSQVSLMNNYIIPLIGDMTLDDISPRLMDKFYRSLPKVKSKVTQTHKPQSEYLTPTNIQRIHKLLRSAFNQAVKWELMARNPCLNATLPKAETKKRQIWTAETQLHALEVCEDDLLALAINLSFSCSLRIGEMLALTWDCIDISEQAITENNASLFVNKELQRVKKETMKELDNKDVIEQFPELLKVNKTVLPMSTLTSLMRIADLTLKNSRNSSIRQKDCERRKEQLCRLQNLSISKKRTKPQLTVRKSRSRLKKNQNLNRIRCRLTMD